MKQWNNETVAAERFLHNDLSLTSHNRPANKAYANECMTANELKELNSKWRNYVVGARRQNNAWRPSSGPPFVGLMVF